MLIRPRLLTVVAAAILWGVAGARADPSQDDILAAVKRGEIRPLSEIEALVKEALPGAVIRTELERKRGVWVYEFKTLEPSGRRSDVYVDAATGKILKVEWK